MRSERTREPSSDVVAGASRVYLLQLLQRSQEGASAVVNEALREGRSLHEIHEAIIGPAIDEAFALWRSGDATLADAHYCAASTQGILAHLKARSPRAAPNGRRLLAIAFGEAPHDLRARMIADRHELAGWSAEALGSEAGGDALAASLGRDDAERPDLVAIAASDESGMIEAVRFVTALRAAPSTRGLRVAFADLGLASAPQVARSLGVDVLSDRQ